MDRRLLILGAAVVIAALIIGAAPVAGSQTTLLKKILKGVHALQEPIGYEYYTSEISSYGPTIMYISHLTNCGNTTADVHWEVWARTPSNPEPHLAYSGDLTIEPSHTRYCQPSFSADSTYSYWFKFTTDSKYVTPMIVLHNTTSGQFIDIYHPGDFQVIEIYN